MTKVNKKTYAEFTVPGLLFSESEVIEVGHRDALRLNIPKAAFGVRFFDILITSVANKGKKTVKAESNPVNKSRYYKIGTKIYTASEVQAETEKEKAKLSKDTIRGRENMLEDMKQKKLKFALKCQVGGFIKLEKGNLVLLVNGKKREVVKIK